MSPLKIQHIKNPRNSQEESNSEVKANTLGPFFSVKNMMSLKKSMSFWFFIKFQKIPLHYRFFFEIMPVGIANFSAWP